MRAGNEYRGYAAAWLIGVACWLTATNGCSPTALYACRIPVFRYALERWEPSDYLLLVLSRGPLLPQEQQLADALRDTVERAGAPANLRLMSIDLDRPLEEQVVSEALRDQVERYRQTSLPAMVLLFPDDDSESGQDRLAWQGPLDAAHVSRLLDSPLRRQIADRILQGDSAVWLLIESGNAEADERAAESLSQHLRQMERRLELPPQEELEAEDEYRSDTLVSLRIGFSVLRVSRDRPEESVLLAILLRSESDLLEFDEPIAIPVYGRGRTYFALIGQGIHEGTVGDACRFVCGDCSCQVKAQNPGRDLLMAVDWDGRITGSALPVPQLPELTGIGSLIADDPPAEDRGSEGPDEPAAAEPSALQAPALRSWNLWGGLVAIASAGLIVWFAARWLLPGG